jgi:hypothetical protein
MDEITKLEILQFLKGEIKYDKDGAYLWAVKHNGHHQKIADVRAWGAIQNLFINKKGLLDSVQAEKFHDAMGEFIAEAIREKIQRENNKRILTDTLL